jgi:hypothetical protein
LIGNGLGSFADFTTYAITDGAYSIVSGDFNGDNAIDLAAADKPSNNISLYIGNGLGSFDPAINFTVGTGPESVIAADFNGDGNLDLATANYTSNNLSVLMSDGLGNFAAATNFPVGTAPTSIVSADFNEDGKMDLVTTNANSNNVSVLLNFIPIVTASLNDATITADQNEATYQWINCNGFEPISGETNQSFNATATGDYAVIVTQNGCSDTSACYSINTVGIIENSSSDALDIFPNPSNGNTTLSIQLLEAQQVNLFILDLQGKIQFQQNYSFKSGKNEVLLDLSTLADGVYFIQLENSNFKHTKRLVKLEN